MDNNNNNNSYQLHLLERFLGYLFVTVLLSKPYVYEAHDHDNPAQRTPLHRTYLERFIDFLLENDPCECITFATSYHVYPECQYEDFEFTGSMLNVLDMLDSSGFGLKIIAEFLREGFEAPQITEERISRQKIYLPRMNEAKRERAWFLCGIDTQTSDQAPGLLPDPFDCAHKVALLKQLYNEGCLYEEIPLQFRKRFAIRDVYIWDVYERIAKLKMKGELEARAPLPAAVMEKRERRMR